MKNNLLKNFICLSSSVKVYIPTTDNVNESVDTTKYVEKTAKLLSECFGGANSESIIGYWMSENFGLVTEKNIRVSASCTSESLEKHMEKVILLCKEIKKDLHQEAVALEVNNEMYLI